MEYTRKEETTVPVTLTLWRHAPILTLQILLAILRIIV